MTLIAIILTLFLLGIIILFAFPKFSPIPYFPSNPVDIDIITQALELKNNQVILDLGAGDGLVIFKAAFLAYKQNLNTEFIALEINPLLVAILYMKLLFHPNRKRIHIEVKDIFKAHYKSVIESHLQKAAPEYMPTFYMYISPWLIKQAIDQTDKSIESYNVVSYFYPVPFLKQTKKIEGKNTVYIYR